MSVSPADPAGPARSGLGHYLPFVVFIGLTFLQDRGPWPWFPAAVYALKTAATAWLLWHFRKRYMELDFRFHWSAPLAGVLVIVVWVGLDPFYPHLGKGSFDPTRLEEPALRVAAIGIRITGAFLVVPIMEELFFRSWMARWIINPDFSSVRLGAFTWASLLITTGVFAVGHHQWLAGIFAGLVFHGYVIWKKRLGDAITAHAAANLALAVYVLTTRRWDFW